MVIRCACLGPRHSRHSVYKCRASDIETIRTIFYVFSHYVVLRRDSNSSPPRRLAAMIGAKIRSLVLLWLFCFEIFRLKQHVCNTLFCLLVPGKCLKWSNKYLLLSKPAKFMKMGVRLLHLKNDIFLKY